MISLVTRVDSDWEVTRKVVINDWSVGTMVINIWSPGTVVISCNVGGQ